MLFRVLLEGENKTTRISRNCMRRLLVDKEYATLKCCFIVTERALIPVSIAGVLLIKYTGMTASTKRECYSSAHDMLKAETTP